MASKNENRREALKNIGIALAAATVAGTVGLPEVEAQKTDRMQPKQFRIPASVNSAVQQGGDFSVFVARSGGEASAFVVKAGDTQAIAEMQKTLGAAPARATVVNGVIHVGLGAAASRSSVANNGAINFRGSQVSQNVLFVR